MYIFERTDIPCNPQGRAGCQAHADSVRPEAHATVHPSSVARRARSSAIRCTICRLTEKPHTVELSFPCLLQRMPLNGGWRQPKEQDAAAWHDVRMYPLPAGQG
eukprot:364816-Chlamydomonas_euryale.AAC.4